MTPEERDAALDEVAAKVRELAAEAPASYVKAILAAIEEVRFSDAVLARIEEARIDRDALSEALLADVRQEVEELMTHEFIDSYEPGTMWLAVDRADVLRLLGDQEVRR